MTRIPAWVVIAAATFLLGFLINRLFPSDYSWFLRLRRPAWLTFEAAIPFIWTFIFVCGIASASILWEGQPRTPQTWGLMAGYALLEIVILAYMPVLCGLRSLRAGTIVGATGFLVGGILALLVWPLSPTAGLLLLPFLLWSPIGTYVTWAMLQINPEAV